MSEPDILYPAIFVFSLLLIGLLLTMWEFSRLRKAHRANDTARKPVSAARSADSAARVAKASGF